MQTRLPPGVSVADFQTAVRRLQDVVGSDWVLTDDEDIGTYMDAYTPFRGDDADEYVPCGAVAPTEVTQVQQIVRIANDHRIPLWPVSTGRNLGYGGSAPRLSGSMVLDLKRMNRVLEVNEPRAYALVEPGVSYFECGTGSTRCRHFVRARLRTPSSLPSPTIWPAITQT